MLQMLDEHDCESIAAANALPSERCLSIVVAKCVCSRRLAIAINHPMDATAVEVSSVARVIIRCHCHRGRALMMTPLEYGPCTDHGGIEAVAANSLRRARAKGAISIGPVVTRRVDTDVIPWRDLR